jgi:hypothetical protein
MTIGKEPLGIWPWANWRHMKATQVFTPTGLPGVTYVDDHLLDRSRQLADALETGATAISLSGPSKSGKTTFIEKELGKDRLVQVTGAGILSAKQLWDRVFDIIGTPVAQRVTTGTSFEGSVGGKLSAEAAVPLLAKGGGEVAAGGKWATMSERQVEVAVDYLQLLIRELKGTNLVIFIDDFHYIPREIQAEVANQIKEGIRTGITFIVASVPYHSDDAVRANPDLRGRTVNFDFDYWRNAELEKIAQRGFEALNLAASPAYVAALASEAAGSPQLMQTLCLNTCFENDVRERQETRRQLTVDVDAIRTVCGRAASTINYASTVDKMREGPKVRGQGRNSYVLKEGTASDVYPLIVKAIAIDPPELTLRYPNLTKRIESLCAGEIPSGSSITGACSHIAAIASDAEAKVVIEWDSTADVLDIRDPYLLFYLRWSGR